MTAKQLSAPLPGDVVATQTSQCNHNSISPGLDQIQCKSCHRCWPQRHPDYERLLNQPSIVAPEQTDIVLEQIGVAPEQTDIVLEQIGVAPEQTDIVLEQIGVAPEQTDIVLEQIGVAPEQTDIVLEQIGVAPEQTDIVLEQIGVAPEQTDIVLEQIPAVAPEQIHWVEVYSPSNRKHCTYYRYMWMEGRKLCRCHIPGSAKGISAIARKQEIERAIACGWWPTEIEELIKSWKN